jgi:putative ABC transport system permease protein
MTGLSHGRTQPGLPRHAAALLRRLLPEAERDEVLAALAEEYGDRERAGGGWPARRWLWRQVLASAPALARRAWWRGWSGFEARADRGGMRQGGAMFEELAMDVRYTLRRLRNRRTYGVLTVMTLALGVGGTAAAWGLVERLLVAPLPVAAESEVVTFWAPRDWTQAELVYLRPHVEQTFRGVAAMRPLDATVTQGDGPARFVEAVAGSAELFDVLGVRPRLGPGFRPGDDVPGADRVAVLSHGLWRELGGDPGIVGERLELSGLPHTVAGVMPEGFWFPTPTVRVWLAEPMNPDQHTGMYELVGRLPAGRSVDGMAPELARIGGLLGEFRSYPEGWDKTADPYLTPLRERVLGPVRLPLLALLGAMGVLLLIASVNVAALMLGQVDARGTELALRSALGAGRRRLLRQLVVESAVIGVLAGLAGAALAAGGFRFLADAVPLGALSDRATVAWPVFAAAMGLALVAATLIALVPGVAIARGEVRARLVGAWTGGVGAGGGGGGGGRHGGRLEGALVVAQVALVLLMASGAALLIRSVANLRAIDPGVDVRGVAVVDVVVPAVVPVAERPRVVQEMVAAVASLPGVASAGVAQPLPLRRGGNNWGITVEGRPELEQTTTFFRVVTPGYFETMGIRLRSGRGLQDGDRFATEEGVVVINQALADRYFPGMDPIGHRIAFMQGRWDRIVGIVENVAEGSLTDEAGPARYMLYEHVPLLRPAHAVVLRAEGRRNAAALLEPARRALEAAVPGVAVQELTTMESVFNQAIGPARQVMALLTLLGALALALGVVGVYGVVAHFVTRRRREWAVRMAMGLVPPAVVRQVVARGAGLVAAGIAVGVAAFLVLARLLAAFLHDVGTADPAAIAGAAGLIMVAGVAAAWIPARRASRIDPAVVLREQ